MVVNPPSSPFLHLSATSCHPLTKYQYPLWTYIFDRRRLAKRSAIFITGSVEKVLAWCGIAIYRDCLRLDVTWSGIFYTHIGQQTIRHRFILKNYIMSDKLQGFTGQIWNLPEISGSPAFFTISGQVWLKLAQWIWGRRFLNFINIFSFH